MHHETTPQRGNATGGIPGAGRGATERRAQKTLRRCSFELIA